jgi:hypothetical protein
MIPLLEIVFIRRTAGQSRERRSVNKRKYRSQGILSDFGVSFSRVGLHSLVDQRNETKRMNNTLLFCHKSVALGHNKEKEKIKCHVYYQVHH